MANNRDPVVNVDPVRVTGPRSKNRTQGASALAATHCADSNRFMDLTTLGSAYCRPM